MVYYGREIIGGKLHLLISSNWLTLQIQCIWVKINHIVLGYSIIHKSSLLCERLIFQFTIHRILGVGLKRKPLALIVGKRKKQKVWLLKGNVFYSWVHMLLQGGNRKNRVTGYG